MIEGIWRSRSAGERPRIASVLNIVLMSVSGMPNFLTAADLRAQLSNRQVAVPRDFQRCRCEKS
jgi:hypothetical protein